MDQHGWSTTTNKHHSTSASSAVKKSDHVKKHFSVVAVTNGNIGNDMISILFEAKNWYIDATFKVVHKPFTQLFSIHAFVKSGESAKQIPLSFAVMSGKCKQDYIVHLLHEETKWINIQVRLVLENKITYHEERWYSQECSVFGMTIHMEKCLPHNHSMPVQS